MNNLDPAVAENPAELVVYGGVGRAARDWDSFDRIVASLKTLETHQTLLEERLTLLQIRLGSLSQQQHGSQPILRHGMPGIRSFLGPFQCRAKILPSIQRHMIGLGQLILGLGIPVFRFGRQRLDIGGPERADTAQQNNEE